MSATIPTGTKVRTARKAGKCAWDCRGMIAAGDHYIDGDSSYEIAGGFGSERICMNCAPSYLRVSA